MSKTIQTIIIVFFVLFACLCISGCTRKTSVGHAFDNVQHEVVSMKDILPEECKTVEILEKFDKIDAKMQVAQSVCEEKIKSIQIKYERALFGLFLLISLLFLKFFIKR